MATIGASAFYGCTSLQTVNIPENVKTIQSKTFYNCTSLSSVTGFAAADSILANSFQACTSLGSITIPASVKYIGGQAFWSSRLKSLTIEDVDTPLELAYYYLMSSQAGSPFGYNCSIDTIYLGRDIDNDNHNTTLFYTALKAVTIGDQVTERKPSTFSGCKSLKNVTFGKNIEKIGNYAFSSCDSLQSAMLGDKVSSIGAYAFSNCSSMKYIKVKLSAPITIQDSYTFQTTDQKAVLCVPRNSKAAYEAADYWKNFRYIVECPNSDVNQDGNVDVVDVVDIARFVVDNPADSFREYLADLNEDDAVNVADAVVLVNEIAGQTDWQVKRMAVGHGETDTRDALYLAKDADGNLSLHLDGETCFTAFQCSLHLSDAALVESIKLNADRKSGHQLLCHQVGDGEYRVVVLSLSNQTFNGQDGALLHIGLDSELGGLSVSDIQFVTPQGNIYLFDDWSSDNALDWDGVTIMEDMSERHGVDHPTIYNLNGQRLTTPLRGVNIVGGKKVFIK